MDPGTGKEDRRLRFSQPCKVMSAFFVSESSKILAFNMTREDSHVWTEVFDLAGSCNSPLLIKNGVSLARGQNSDKHHFIESTFQDEGRTVTKITVHELPSGTEIKAFSCLTHSLDISRYQFIRGHLLPKLSKGPKALRTAL